MRSLADFGLKRIDSFEKNIFKAYEEGLEYGIPVGWPAFDQHFTLMPGTLNVITGIPGSGKSTWLDQLLIDFVDKNPMGVGMFTPENQPYELHVANLIEKAVRKPFTVGENTRMTKYELEGALDWVKKRFYYIHPKDFKPQTLLEALEAAILWGCKILVIDPWSDVDKERPYGFSEVEYTNKCLTDIRNLARRTKAIIFLVAHPQKMGRATHGERPVVKGYDISGGAMFLNKADTLISIWRDYENKTRTVVHVLKVRYRTIGKITEPEGIEFEYDPVTGRYTEVPGQESTNNSNFQEGR